MGFQLRKFEKLTTNLNGQVTNLTQQYSNLQKSSTDLSTGLKFCKAELDDERKKTKWLKVGIITLTPIALLGGIFLGSMVGN